MGKENLTAIIECPLKIEGCIGLVSTAGGAQIEEVSVGYILRNRRGEIIGGGNCGNYVQCMGWLIRQTTHRRKSAIVKSYNQQEQ